MSQRKRLFFIHAELFNLPIVEGLREQGVDIVAATTRGAGSYEPWKQALPPGTPILYSTEARSMLLPPSLARRVRPARKADIEALAPTAARSLQMIDRMNHKGYSVAELNQTYLHMIGFWRTLMDDLKPDAVVFSHGPPSFGFDYVLYQLARLDGLPTVLFRHTHVESHIMVTGDMFDIKGPTPAEIEAAPPVPAEAAQFASPTNDHMHRQAMNLQVIRQKLSWPGIFRTLIGRRQFGRSEPNPELLYDPTPRYYQLRWQFFRGRIECRQALDLYDGMTKWPDLDAPYLYAPLAKEPEESTMPLGGTFTDTMHTLRVMSQALPPGWRLYVKEHANQFNRKFLMSKGRNLHFYRRVAELPNVTMVPLETDSKELIRRARATALIAGTSGWESVQVGTPALVFGFPWYLHSPGVTQVDGVESCRRALARIAAEGTRVSIDHVRRYEKLMRERYLTKLIYSTEFLPFNQMELKDHLTAYMAEIRRMIGHGGPHVAARAPRELGLA